MMRKIRVRAQSGVAVALAAVLTLTAAGVAQAVTFDTDETSQVRLASSSDCPTIAKPEPFEAWFNIEDMNRRGFVDPKNQTPWPFAAKARPSDLRCRDQLQDQDRHVFIRALGTMTEESLGARPESDTEVIYDALEYVHKNRGVEIGLVLDGGTVSPSSAKNLITKRLAPISKIFWCLNGCLNTNAPSVFPYSVNHEKFITVSDTKWDSGVDPVVYSSSGNLARSQIRNYLQEASLLYNDVKLFTLFTQALRHNGGLRGHRVREQQRLSRGCAVGKDRGIWVDPFYRHWTDADRGTAVSFSPQPSTAEDHYIRQFDGVDCAVDKKIRIGMAQLTDSKATQMVNALVRLKNRGCDVKMLLTQQGGSTTISPTVVSLLKSANISARCTAVAMHTKMILIGPMTNDSGRVLFGTANMSTSALRYSEEHVITIDSRRASPAFADSIRRVYGVYMAAWTELNKTSKSCG
ncbi:MAG: hypothetical protein IPO80_02935 [Propionibacteriaceae bacterium]|nr:hypothetical protein [Propionibacteriaceae bacterium]